MSQIIPNAKIQVQTLPTRIFSGRNASTICQGMGTPDLSGFPARNGGPQDARGHFWALSSSATNSAHYGVATSSLVGCWLLRFYVVFGAQFPLQRTELTVSYRKSLRAFFGLSGLHTGVGGTLTRTLTCLCRLVGALEHLPPTGFLEQEPTKGV